MLVFYDEDDKLTARLVATLARVPGVQAVNRLSTKLGDLLLFGEYRVVEVPRTVVRRGGKVLYDEVGAPTPNEARELLCRWD